MDLNQVMQKIYPKAHIDVRTEPKYFKFVQSNVLNKMKKIPLLILFAVSFLFCSIVHGQKLTLGVKGGLCFPSLTGGTSGNPTFDSNSLKYGVESGIFGEYHVSEKLSYSMGIEYSLQGGLNLFKSFPTPSNLSASGLGNYLYSDFKSDINLNYILVPFLVRKTWKINHKFRIYAGAGPCLAVLFKANRSISSGPIYEDQARTTMISIPLQMIDNSGAQKLNAYNVGLNGLLGLSCKLNNKESVFIEIGAVNTFFAIQENVANGACKTFSEMVTIGYAFTYKQHYKNRYH